MFQPVIRRRTMSSLSPRPSRFAILKASRPVLEDLESRRLLSGTIEVTNGLDENAGGSAYPGSLRAAIVQANANPGSTIEFGSLAAGSTITLGSALPAITAAGTIIDGTTGPGGRVTVKGVGDGAQYSEFVVTAAEFSMKGMQVEDCGTALTLGGGSSAASITNNYIGGLGTSNYNSNGILIDAGSTGDTIGGAEASDRNVISGDIGENPDAPAGYGAVVIYGNTTTGNLVEGNWIGLDATGDGAAPNQIGVVLSGGTSGNTVSGNCISGNSSLGIYEGYALMTYGDGGNNTIEGNSFGLNATGTGAVPNNVASVVELSSVTTSNSVTTPGDTFSVNTIEDNIVDSGSENGDGAILVQGPNNKLVSNTIADNTCSAGIIVASYAEDNTISQNTIYSNRLTPGGTSVLGIDLGGTGTPLPNSQTGGLTTSTANGDQPYPTLTLTSSGGSLDVGLSLTSNPGTSYTIELFATAPADISTAGYGPGQTYISSVTLVTGENGSGTATTQISEASYSGDYITATATNASAYNADSNPDAGATSEFSQNVAGPGVTTPTVSIASASATEGSNIYFTATLGSAVSGAVTASFALTPGTATTADFDASGGTLTFPAGTTQETIGVPTYGDASGTDESFTLTLSDLSSNAIFSNNQTTETTTGTILPFATGTKTSSIAVGASSSSIAAGGSVTLTGTVTGGFGTPTGVVTFLNNGTSLGTGTVSSSGVASITLSSLESGTYSVTAAYGGDGTYAASTSTPITVDVGGGSTSNAASVTTFAAPAKTLTVGQEDSFTLTVTSGTGTGPTPTGSVSIYEDGTQTGTYTLAADGQAVVSYTVENANPDTVFSAVYSGDANYASSISNSVTQVYLPRSSAAATVSRAVVPAAAVAGQKFTAKVPVVAVNTGSALDGAFTIVLYADSSAAGLDANPNRLASVVKKVNLKPNKSLAVSFAVHSLPASLPAGLYYLAVQITDPLGNATLATTADAVAVAAPVVTLVPSFVSVRPALLKPAQSGTAVITLSNTGNITASGLVQLNISPSSDGVTALPVTMASIAKRIVIKPGKSVRISIKFRIPLALDAGTYQLFLATTFNDSTTNAIGGVITVT